MCSYVSVVLMLNSWMLLLTAPLESQELLCYDTFLQLFSCRTYLYGFTSRMEKTCFPGCSNIIFPSDCNRTAMCASTCCCDELWSTACAWLQELEDVAMYSQEPKSLFLKALYDWGFCWNKVPFTRDYGNDFPASFFCHWSTVNLHQIITKSSGSVYKKRICS